MKWIKTILMALIMTNTACAQEFEKDTFKAPSGKEIEIYAIKHGSMRIVFDGKEIEVDPVEALEPATDYSLLPKADFILVTHEHFDHLDKKAIAHLTKEDTRIIKPKVLFPYHYGETHINKVEELLKRSGIEVRIRNYQ